MAEHMVTLWLEGDDDPDIAWEAFAKEHFFSVTHKTIRTFPWSDVHHEINWWITRRLTMEEWIKLDDVGSEAMESVLGDDFMGTAGPIPFPDRED